MPNANTRLKPKANTAAIRCYGQGLGDCFLLAFPRPGQPNKPFYLAIDCGIARGTSDEEARMQTVVADIRDATGGRLDVLAVTHQHYDHVSGFVHAEALWQQFEVERVFAPWTEKPGDPDAATVGQAALRLNAAAALAAERAMRLDGEPLAAGGETFGVSAAVAIRRGWETALSLCARERLVYCEPGDVIPLDDTGVNAYVLGPPRLKDRAGQDLVGRTGTPLVFVLEDHREMYSYEHFGLHPDGPALAGAAAAQRGELRVNAAGGATRAIASALLGSGPDGDDAFDRFSPFDRTLRIDLDEALKDPFFQQHYQVDADWRGVDDAWLDGAGDLALRAGGFTNNISLVLAFELPQTRKVLLFVGDAQVGSWLSWHRIGQSQAPGDAQPGQMADMPDLLGRVAFYKVGHHGSHNATVRAQGLELMPDGLVAYIPVSVPVAHDIMGYCPMPFYPLLLALQEKTGGAVFLANGNLLEPLPNPADRAQFEVGVRRSSAQLGPKVRKPGTPDEETIEEAVPLWIEFTLED